MRVRLCSITELNRTDRVIGFDLDRLVSSFFSRFCVIREQMCYQSWRDPNGCSCRNLQTVRDTWLGCQLLSSPRFVPCVTENKVFDQFVTTLRHLFDNFLMTSTSTGQSKCDNCGRRSCQAPCWLSVSCQLRLSQTCSKSLV